MLLIGQPMAQNDLSPLLNLSRGFVFVSVGKCLNYPRPKSQRPACAHRPWRLLTAPVHKSHQKAKVKQFHIQNVTENAEKTAKTLCKTMKIFRIYSKCEANYFSEPWFFEQNLLTKALNQCIVPVFRTKHKMWACVKLMPTTRTYVGKIL